GRRAVCRRLSLLLRRLTRLPRGRSCNMPTRRFCRRVFHWGRPMPRKATRTGTIKSRREAPKRRALSRRLREAIGGQLDAIDHVNKLIAKQSELGQSDRAVAAVSRSLRETHELLQPPEEEHKLDVAHDEPFPYDVEQFRRELARALRAVLDERRSGAARESDEPVRQAVGPRPGEAED